MQTKLTILSVATMLALTACGGGSSGDQVSNSSNGNQVSNGNNSNTSDSDTANTNTTADSETTGNTDTTTPVVSHNTPFNSGLSNEDRRDAQIFSKLMQQDSKGDREFYTEVGSWRGSSFRHIVNGISSTSRTVDVDNKTITSSRNSHIAHIPQNTDQAIHKNGFYTYGSFDGEEGYHENGTSYRYFTVSDDNYKDVQYGLGRIFENAREKIEIFSRARTTPASMMPNSGTAKYSGNIVGIHDGKEFLGDVKADVDFAEKQARFALSIASTQQNIDAEIIGSGFKGKAFKKEIQGLFGGDNAAEMTGTYMDFQTNTVGVFGAK